jgi:predicted MFS family arabinose efflux permease
LIGTLLVASRQNTCQLVRLVATGWLLAAVGLAFLGGTGELAVAMLASMGIGMGITSVNVSTNAVLQSLTPDAIRGRVISFFTAFRFGMDALGGLLAGLLTHRYGVQPVLCGEAVMVVLGTLWMASQIRRVSRAAAGAGV